MEPVDEREIARLLFEYGAGKLTPEEEGTLFEAAASNQELFNEVMEAEALRSAFLEPGERERASEFLRAWEEREELLSTDLKVAAVTQPPRKEPLWVSILRPALTSFATALAGSLSYAVIKNVGSSLGVGGPALNPAPSAPVPSILHEAHAAIAALLLGLQFTPLLRPQTISGDHPIATKCLSQFIRGWRWAWAAWLVFYTWLAIHPQLRSPWNPVTDILNGLTAFPLFWCFLVLDKPSVSVPARPGRDTAFRRAVAMTWGVGAGTIALAIASRLGWWGLGGFGVAFLGIYEGLAIAFLVGRFDSHWMQVPRWMLAPLYGYALIQMIYVFFDQIDPAWSVYTYLVALLLKVCLFFIVTHLLHAGNIARYLVAAEKGELGPQSR